MKLLKLLSGVHVLNWIGEKKSQIKSITDDSRNVVSGSLFIAIKGLTTDGHNYINNAFSNGASAVVCESLPKNFKLIRGKSVIIVKSTREALGNISSEYFGNPSKKLYVIGVTGTKGKTTTSYYIYQLLKNMGIKCGLVTSVSALVGDRSYDTGFHVTNPDCISTHRFLAKMKKLGCTHVVLEISSHGIDQKRIAGIKFDIGVLTNIAPEHLDYHKTFANYRNIKLSLLKQSTKSVINADDPNFSYLRKQLKSPYVYSLVKNLPFPLSKVVSASNIKGAFNKSNFMAAVTSVLAAGINSEKLQNIDFDPLLPEGRLEEVKNNLGINIIIDFAHTPESLESALTYLKSFGGRVIAVFGCAGERDPRKRPKMGKISGKLSDLTVITAEDPRSENVMNIISTIAEGCVKSGVREIINDNYNTAVDGGNKTAKYFIRIPDRKEAIEFALKHANPGDVVGIFGKGHEKSMNYDGINETPWSDRKVVESYLNGYPIPAAAILAGGKGTRMKSKKPKVLFKILGKPMASYIISTLKKAGFQKVTMLVGHKSSDVMKTYGSHVDYAFQKQQLGTGDAAYCAIKTFPPKYRDILVVNGDDSMFYSQSTVMGIFKYHVDNNNMMTFATASLKNPFGIGRVERTSDGQLVGVIEEKDATQRQKKINECNIGLYVFNVKWLKRMAKKIPKSNSGEYYIVSLIEMALKNKDNVSNFTVSESEFHGINTKDQLLEANLKMRRLIS